jgi:DNA-binding CsgD family transcriptional regulator
MNQQLSFAQATFGPQQFKTFEGALDAFLAQECPQLGGFRTRQVLTQSIGHMVREFYPETTHLQPGQTPWVTVAKDERAGYGKRIQQTRLTPVVLAVVQPHDAQERANGKKLREIKREATARLFTQAYEQGGCMTHAEVALLLKISAPTVSNYVRDWELEHHTVLPTRGSIHDMGPTLSHKKIIIHKLFIEQKSVQQVSRETYHSFEAIQRYISTFKRVLLCRQKGLSTDETAYTVKLSRRLVQQYEAIIEEYQNQAHILDRLLHYEAPIEEPDPYYS